MGSADITADRAATAADAATVKEDKWRLVLRDGIYVVALGKRGVVLLIAVKAILTTERNAIQLDR